MRTPVHFDVESRTLPNGLRVLLMRRPVLPVVSLTALVDAGAACQGTEEAGLATFTAGLLPLGTARRTAVQLAEDVDALGASLGVHADSDFALVAVSALSRHQESAVSTLAEVLTAPAFDPAEVERRRSDLLAFLERRKDDPSGTVRNTFLEQIYGDHPYRDPREGTERTVSGLEASDLRRFFDRWYLPERTLLAVVGDFEVDPMFDRISEQLGGWARRDLPTPAPAAIPDPGPLCVRRIQKDGVTQATLRVGSIGLERAHPDYVPVTLLNYILGGSGFGSRLMRRLREERGLTYGAYSTFHFRRERGYFSAVCQTGLATMNDALEDMLAEIRRIREDGIQQGELDWARRFYSGSLPLSLQTNDQLATRVLEQEYYGLEQEFWLRDIEKMESATVADVNEAARRYLHPDRLAIVCLGDFREAELRDPAC